MKRLTEREEHGLPFYPRCFELCEGTPGSRYGENGTCDKCEEEYKQAELLAAYEDTGLTPEQIKALAAKLATIDEVKEIHSTTPTVVETIISVIDEMCGKYCKWRDQYDLDNEEELYSKHCDHCPVNKLM